MRVEDQQSTNMKKKLQQLQKDFATAIKKIADVTGLEKLEAEYFSRKSGQMTNIMKEMKSLSADVKKEVGKLSNDVKNEIQNLITKKREELEAKKWESIKTDEKIDVTAPRLPSKKQGTIHPITQARWDMEDVARSMGFTIEDGPELESDHYVFEAINIPKHHPARDSQDTFYIKGNPEWCMRSHVSNMQGRMLEKYGAPLRAAYPGRSFRNEALDATHEHTFMQFEALVVDKNINIGNLVGIIKELLKGLYKKDDIEVRLRPSYFPFVEPGFELDMKYTDKNGEEKWMEMLGCGLMHPSVIEQAGLDPNEYQGLAFGMGLDRLVMLKHEIEDIRHLRAGDLRFLKQF